MRNVRKYFKRSGWSVTSVVCVWLVANCVQAESIFESLVPPLRSNTPSGLNFYYDKSGALNLVYLSKQSETPGALNSIVYSNQHWSSPLNLGLLSQNKRDLAGIVRLSTGTPMLLLKGDDTDYGAMFNLSVPPAEPVNENDPIIPGVNQTELETLLDDNQRLFYSFFTNAGWSPPQLLAGTSRAINPQIAAGQQDGAIVVFSQDGDKNITTVNDQELYFTVLDNNYWSTPAPITNNNTTEFNVRIVSVNGVYMLVWVSDADNNLDTNDDWTMHYTSITQNGQLNPEQAVINTPQPAAVPILGIVQNQAALLWQGPAAGVDDPRRPLLISRFTTGWSAPEATGLFGLQVVNGEVYSTGGGDLLVYFDSGVVQAALYLNGVWHNVDALADIHSAGYSLSELSHYYSQDNSLWLAISAHVPAVGEAGGAVIDDEIGDGVYVARIPLSYDLAPTVVSNTPYIKRLGGQATITAKVGNLGALPSPDYALLIHQNAQVIATLSGTSLAPGQTQNLSHSLTLSQATLPLEIEVAAVGLDADVTNNRLDYAIKIMPDFAVRSVKLETATRIVADIVEHKGISAVPVPVDILLMEQGQQTPLASLEYDTNKAEPIVFDSNVLATKTGAYQVVVQINPQRSVEEDDYSNNQSAYNVIPQPDFVIGRLEVDTETVRVSIANRGTSAAPAVGLLVTDDPQAAVSTTLPATPWYYQPSIVLDTNGEAVVEIQRSAQAPLQGTTLYAVVNPLGQVKESSRTNNQAKMVIANVQAPPVTPPPGGQSGKLELLSLTGWCQNVQATLSNTGELSVIAPSVEVFTQSGISVAKRVVPVIIPGEQREVTFHGLPYATYDVRVIYVDPVGQEKLIQQTTVQLTEAFGCVQSANQDVELVGLALISPGAGSADLILRATVDALGFNTGYRKPLVRVPVRIDVKQGTTSYYVATEVVYVPATTGGVNHTFDISIPRSFFPSGIARVEARLLERNDERDSANNSSALDVNVEAL